MSVISISVIYFCHMSPVHVIYCESLWYELCNASELLAQMLMIISKIDL